jgi:Asp-tRNA(Asn)/Glu-tRNA(Gln) amidotransferase A subunit family amidase
MNEPQMITVEQAQEMAKAAAKEALEQRQRQIDNAFAGIDAAIKELETQQRMTHAASLRAARNNQREGGVERLCKWLGV